MAGSDIPTYHPWNFCPECGGPLNARPDAEGNSPFCPRCDRFYYHNPPPVVACLAVSEGKVLFVKRGVEPARGLWALPGGFVDLGESPEQAALRELEEETILKGRIHRLVGALSQESALYGSVLVLGLLISVEGEPCPGSDALEAAFFPPSEAPEPAFRSHAELLSVLSEADLSV